LTNLTALPQAGARNDMLDFFHMHETTILWLAASSLVTFIASLIIVPLLVIRIPSDYFSQRKRRRPPWANHHPLLRAVLLVSKNLCGYVFLLAGILMLVLPGQGLLTIFIGVMLLDFPGKYLLERWLVTRRPVLRSINWLRRRAMRPPLHPDM
jgi:hypothetical protein